MRIVRLLTRQHELDYYRSGVYFGPKDLDRVEFGYLSNVVHFSIYRKGKKKSIFQNIKISSAPKDVDPIKWGSVICPIYRNIEIIEGSEICRSSSGDRLCVRGVFAFDYRNREISVYRNIQMSNAPKYLPVDRQVGIGYGIICPDVFTFDISK